MCFCSSSRWTAIFCLKNRESVWAGEFPQGYTNNRNRVLVMKFNESLNDFITIVVVLVLVLVLVLVILVVLVVLVILVILVIFVLILIFVLIVIVIIIIISITIIIIVSLSLLLLLLTVFSLFSLLSLSSVSATPSPMISILNGDYTMYSYGDILNNHHVNHHNQQRPACPSD